VQLVPIKMASAIPARMVAAPCSLQQPIRTGQPKG
jgi:hypothetical protein